MDDHSNPKNPPFPTRYETDDETGKEVTIIHAPEIIVKGIGINIQWIPAEESFSNSQGSVIEFDESDRGTVLNEFADVECQVHTAIARREAYGI